MDLRHGGDGGLQAATAGALGDGDSRGNAENGIDVRLACGLNHGACIGVERFQVAPLAFVEEDVEGQGGFA